MSETTTVYDEVPYPGYVHAQTQPERLATMATLLGMQPVDVTRSRVLELGCGTGANLIPLAVRYPDSQFIGIDLSSKQIGTGLQTIDAVGIPNLELRAESILDFPPPTSPFDYIIVHGVFSWVPEQVRHAILNIARRHLSPNGVALVSYNTFPGWHQRRMIREMMQYHARSMPTAAEQVQQARTFLAFMTQAVPDDSAYGRSLREEHQMISQAHGSYIFHEQLEQTNDPMYFHQFASLAREHALQFVNEIDWQSHQLTRYPPPVAAALAKMERVQREQYLDFMTRRTFRQTLLCHADVEIDGELDARRLMPLWLESSAAGSPNARQSAERGSMELSTAAGATLRVKHPLLIAAMLELADHWPRHISFEELLVAARRRVGGDAVVVQSTTAFEQDRQFLAASLLQAHLGGMVGVQTGQSSFTREVSAKPEACRLARHQAATGEAVTTRRHQSLQLDEVTRHLVSRLDGQTDHAALLADMLRFVESEGSVLQHQGVVVDDIDRRRELLQAKLLPNLMNLAAQGVLVA